MNIKAKLALLKKEADKVNKKHKTKKKMKKEIILPDFLQEETTYGTAYFRDVNYPLNHRHGDIFLREILEVPGEILAFMGQEDVLENMDVKKTLFLDTETTGLAGGTGTYAFLIGIGFIKEDSFIVRQYFMPDYSYEPAMLQHINEFIKDYTGMVTFNGKSYDFPLIKSRFSLNRLKLSLPSPLHLDLLHGSRRLWKRTHGSCKLTALEGSVLDFYREDDVPGFLIPDMFFQYLKDRDFRPMEKVFEHNVFDIVTMAALIVRMWSHLEMAESGMVCGSEYYSLGAVYEKRKDEDNALRFYERALKERLSPSMKTKVRQKIARIYKRRDMFEEALNIWIEMAEEAVLDIYAHIELAKFHEHKTKDLKQAIHYVEEAGKIVERKKRTGSVSLYYKEIKQVNHRRKRLLSKSEKEQPE